MPREKSVRRPRGRAHLEGQIRLVVPPPQRRREDRRDALRERFLERPVPRRWRPRAASSKRALLSDYTNSTREGGVIGINLADNDSVIGTVLTTGSDEIILVSHQGLAVRFRERDAESGEELFRATGRATGGVTGMRFKLDSDYLQAIEVVDHTSKFLVASEAGLGVRTRFEDYRLINRGGSGVWAIDLPEDGSVKLVGALSVKDTDEIMLLTTKGQSVRCPVNTIREVNRGGKGVKLLTLAEGDKLLSIARVVETAEELDAAAVGTTPPAN
ncbi:MAG: DNA gyrase C-terminal beta-propeller domain-containing protein [Nibricoccus sp.]